MPNSDRAFRALARAQPEVIAGLLNAVAPGLLPEGAALTTEDVAPTHLDGLPPELDADFATRVGAAELVHLECQGYRDTGFEARALWYHVGFALRNRNKRKVSTVALWLTSPPKHQPRGEMRVDDITVKVTTVLLHEVKASALLASPKTSCFAAGAQAEGRTTEALCAEVAAALCAHNATWAERHMAVVAAAMRGRYKEMVSAMEQVNLEPVMIEDLVKFGEDRGKRRGLKEGIKKGRAEGRQEGRAEGRQEGRAEGRLVEKRAALRRVLELRKLALSPEQDHQIDTCTDLAALGRWLDQAIFAASAAEALE